MNINRHEAYYPDEIRRILKPKGVFITQQVGFLSEANLIKDISGKKAKYCNWNLQSAANELKESEFNIKYKDEEIVKTRFYDIEAIVYYLKAIPWLVEDFEPRRYIDQLKHINSLIEDNGYYDDITHRFIIKAET